MGRHFLVTGETEVERVLRYSFLVFVKEKKKSTRITIVYKLLGIQNTKPVKRTGRVLKNKH